ncbi:MAG: hypothetical protein R2817_12970 [Flavobacteriales bacterium]
MFHGARILVAPLDWGLGHATRCIPIIRRLVEQGATPVIGADRGPLAVLRAEFPELEHVVLPGPVIRYSASGRQLWSMVRQFPAMVRSVPQERAVLQGLRRRMHLDAVISDQRFGLRDAGLPSVVLTHQVFPFTPAAQGALRRLNRYHLAAFDQCWVVDHANAPGLAGELAHGPALPPNARYIGTLSRMRADAPAPVQTYDVVAVISGPEPQRGLLEQRLLQQLRTFPGRHLLVRGLPQGGTAEQQGNVQLVPHLPAAALNAHLLHARHIITRTGYTTLMDLEALGRAAVLIPTPGQAEQEYLGRLHAPLEWHVVRNQEHVQVAEAIAALPRTTNAPHQPNDGPLQAALEDLARRLH